MSCRVTISCLCNVLLQKKKAFNALKLWFFSSLIIYLKGGLLKPKSYKENLSQLSVCENSKTWEKKKCDKRRWKKLFCSSNFCNSKNISKKITFEIFSKLFEKKLKYAQKTFDNSECRILTRIKYIGVLLNYMTNFKKFSLERNRSIPLTNVPKNIIKSR